MSIRLPAPRRRRQLLDVALTVFGSQGFHATPMNEVAATAGVTKPVLYQHFRSKRALYSELIADVGEGLRDAIGKAIANAVTVADQVEQAFVAYFRFLRDQPGAFEVLFGGDAQNDREFAGAVRDIEDSLAETVAALLDVDDLSAERRQVVGHGIIDLAEGAARHWTNSGCTADPTGLAHELAALAWPDLGGAGELVAPAHQ